MKDCANCALGKIVSGSAERGAFLAEAYQIGLAHAEADEAPDESHRHERDDWVEVDAEVLAMAELEAMALVVDGFHLLLLLRFPSAFRVVRHSRQVPIKSVKSSNVCLQFCNAAKNARVSTRSGLSRWKSQRLIGSFSVFSTKFTSVCVPQLMRSLSFGVPEHTASLSVRSGSLGRDKHVTTSTCTGKCMCAKHIRAVCCVTISIFHVQSRGTDGEWATTIDQCGFPRALAMRSAVMSCTN